MNSAAVLVALMKLFLKTLINAPLKFHAATFAALCWVNYRTRYASGTDSETLSQSANISFVPSVCAVCVSCELKIRGGGIEPELPHSRRYDDRHVQE